MWSLTGFNSTLNIKKVPDRISVCTHPWHQIGAKGVYKQISFQRITIGSNIENSFSSSILFRHNMSITQQLMPLYNITVHKNKINNVLHMLNCSYSKTQTCHKDRNLLSPNLNSAKLTSKERIKTHLTFNMRTKLQKKNQLTPSNDSDFNIKPCKLSITLAYKSYGS